MAASISQTVASARPMSSVLFVLLTPLPVLVPVTFRYLMIVYDINE